MATKATSKPFMIRWTTLKGLAALITFLIIAVLFEYAVVLYAISLGVQEKPENMIFGVISPLFHLVPIAVIIVLASTWTYLTRHVAAKPQEIAKVKAGASAKKGKESKIKAFFSRIGRRLSNVKGVSYLWQRVHFARATVRSALTVLLVFAAFILMVSVLAYPILIYNVVANAYRSNPWLLNFVKGTAEALAPIGGAFSTVNDALRAAAPSFRDFVLNIGVLTKPLTSLDNAGKYLAFQNFAAWISALVALIYGEYLRKGYRHRKSGRFK
ncbi:MAG: hypothetical protein QXF44_01755 [Candidatus Bathyarchaeia archaeon]